MVNMTTIVFLWSLLMKPWLINFMSIDCLMTNGLINDNVSKIVVDLCLIGVCISG